jgi:hypothetical protein
MGKETNKAAGYFSALIVVSFVPPSSTLKLEMIRSTETLGSIRNSLCDNPVIFAAVIT